MPTMVKKDFFIGNDWDVHRFNIKNRGVLIGAGDGVVARALISVSPAGDALHADLAIASLDWLADGEVIGTIQGTASDEHILSLWTTAAAAAGFQFLKLYERVIVDDADYKDVVELHVYRDRPPEEPPEAEV